MLKGKAILLLHPLTGDSHAEIKTCERPQHCNNTHTDEFEKATQVISLC